MVDLERKAKTVELGDEVKDKISGFRGVCTGLFSYINGCVRAMIEPRTLHDGKPNRRADLRRIAGRRGEEVGRPVVRWCQRTWWSSPESACAQGSSRNGPLT